MKAQDIRPVFDKQDQPILIAGPCSAETEEQVLQTARELAVQGIDLFRAGIWKPRTRPDSFEGVGSEGLPWLQRVRRETGLRVTTEVATAQHVAEALEYEVDVLWLGARTTANPFSVQEVADALQGMDVPVLVKNPVNPDINLWIGAIERLYKAGIRRIAAIHRGFSYHGETPFRNVPRWQIPIELKRRLPELQLICDNSHICGRRDLLLEVAQSALDLNYDGLMTEVHPDPDRAWSDAMQQLTPKKYREMLHALVIRSRMVDDIEFLERLAEVRLQIDDIDSEIIHLLAARMNLAEQIGTFKKERQVAILQARRWNEVLENSLEKGKALGLSPAFMQEVFQSIHQESIFHQSKVMNHDQAQPDAER